MRIVITQNITLDGRIEMLGDWFDPSDQDEELAHTMRELTAREEILLLGRQTFEDFRGYWPLQVDDTTGTREALNKVDKHVVTSTLTEPQWENTTLVSGDPLDHVRNLRDRDGGEVCVTGSITLCHALIDADLVDEYRFFTYPVWQGEGRGLVPTELSDKRFERADQRTFTGGVSYAAYRPVG